MAVITSLNSLIQGGSQPTIKSGDFLQAPTDPAGFIATYKESDGYVVNGTNLYQIVGQGTIATNGVAEVDTLTISAGATANGSVLVTLNDIQYSIPVVNGDTIANVCTKIAAQDFTGAGYTATSTSTTVTFTAQAHGVKPAPAFNGNGTGVADTSFAVTTAGTNDVYNAYNVYPAITDSGNSYKDYKADTTQQPIIIMTSGQVVYTGGRNSSQKDVYSPDGITTVTVTAGQEPKEILKAFLLFAAQNFAFGVTQFENGTVNYVQV